MKRIERFYEKWQIDNIKDFYSVEEMFSFAEDYLEFVNKEKVKDEYRLAGFAEFWESYHKITGKPKTDNESARREWTRLKPEEKEKALSNIAPFYNSLNNKDYCNKAYTYLKNKLFNNEFLNNIMPNNAIVKIGSNISIEDVR